MFNNSYKNNNSGFSLVETLVAITILLLVVVGPLTITSRTAKSSTFAAEQVVAQFLAQEGVELVQKMRDDIVLQSTALGSSPGTSWSSFTGGYSECFNAAGCGLEVSSSGSLGVVRDCSTILNCLLYRSTTGSTRSLYTHTNTGTPSLYTRTIKISTVPGYIDEVKVESVVTWRTGSIVANQQVRVESALFNVYGI